MVNKCYCQPRLNVEWIIQKATQVGAKDAPTHVQNCSESRSQTTLENQMPLNGIIFFSSDFKMVLLLRLGSYSDFGGSQKSSP